MKRSLRLFILVLLSFILMPNCDYVINNEKFSSAEWKNGDARIRGKMVYDLQKSKILIGKTENEVAEILGQSDHKLMDKSRLIGERFRVDTNTPIDIEFTVWYSIETQRVASTDVGN